MDKKSKYSTKPKQMRLCRIKLRISESPKDFFLKIDKDNTVLLVISIQRLLCLCKSVPRQVRQREVQVFRSYFVASEEGTDEQGLSIYC